jgi:cytoskeletal protein RodZ
MKRTYAPHEEHKTLSAAQGHDARQETFGAESQATERPGGILFSQLPTAPTARSLRQPAVRQLQQTHGNAHVQRELLSDISRQEDDELRGPVEAQAPSPATQAPTAEGGAPAPATQAPTAELGPPAPEAQAPDMEAQAPTVETEMPAPEAEAPAAEAGQAPAAISGDGGTVTTDASGVTIDGARLSVNAAAVNVNSPMVTTSGVLRTDTLIADSVVGSSYTPGAGNVW